MKHLKTLLLTITILGFLLPFLPPNCSGTKNKKEITTTDSITTDSISYVKHTNNNILDSSSKKLNTAQQIADTNQAAKFTLSERIFLYPDNENLSGFGYIFILFEKEYFFIFFSFVILWIVVINHLATIKILAFENISLLLIGLSFLLILGIFDYDELKFGYWVTSGVYFITVVIFYIEWKQKHNS